MICLSSAIELPLVEIDCNVNTCWHESLFAKTPEETIADAIELGVDGARLEVSQMIEHWFGESVVSR